MTQRHATWLSTKSGHVAAWLHMPPGDAIRAGGVVVCPPFGHEYTHSHRSVLHLASSLAESGFLTVRFDYLGTGDSEGDERTPQLLNAWIESVLEAAELASRLTHGGPVSLIGVRFGVLIAGLAAARIDIEHLVAWHPVSSGKRYVREQEALHRLARDVAQPRPDPIEAGGFVLARETAESLEAADLRTSALRVRGEALVLDRDDLSAEGRLAAHLESQGVPLEVDVVPGFSGMMAEPQYTVVPRAAIQRIVTWLGSRVKSATWPLAGPALIPRATFEHGSTTVTEELMRIPADPGVELRGVLSSTPATDRRDRTVVVLSNSGSVHHVGPNRLYVEISRALAVEGIETVRFDLRNLGDSCGTDCAHENHPYPPTSVADVRAVLEWLVTERGYNRCVVGGLCSGAYTAFHTGLELEDLPVSGVICLNPLTFQWRDGMSLDTPDSHRSTRDAQYYGNAVRDWKKWKKLLSGKADIRYIARFVRTRVRDVVLTRLRQGAERAGLRQPGQLGRWLEWYAETGKALHFVFSANDPGFAILKSEAGPTVTKLVRRGAIRVDIVEGADHTLSQQRWRVATATYLLRALAETSHGATDVAPVNPEPAAASSPKG